MTGMLGVRGIIVLAAIAPPLCWVALLGALDRRRPRRWGRLAIAFLWGIAAAALVSAPLNDLLLARLGAAAPAERVGALAATTGAPVIEELAKGAGLLLLVLLRRGELRTTRDGIILGAAVGFGFDLAENLQYLTLAAVQGGVPGLARGVWVRGILGGPKHALFTATTGAGLGWAAGRRAPRRQRAGVALVALGAAVLQHAMWNAVAAQAISRALCGAPTPEAACLPSPDGAALFLSVPLIVLACLGPGAVALHVIARRVADTPGAPPGPAVLP